MNRGISPISLLTRTKSHRYFAGSVQYCRNFQLPLFFEKIEFENSEEALKSIMELQQNLNLINRMSKQTVGL